MTLDPMEIEIQEFYHRLKKLEYSEENIAELFSIILGLITSLKQIDSNRETNKCLHFVMLTREKEFDLFESAKKSQWEYNFSEAKSNLLADLNHYCLQNWKN